MMNIAQFVGLGEAPRYLLTLNRVDRDYFRSLIQVWPRPEGLIVPPAATASQKLIGKASAFLKSQIGAYGDLHGIVEVVMRLHRVVNDNLRVVVVSSTSWDDVADVFERLNDRGKGLSTLDLLRNYLIASAPNQQEEAIEEAWNDVYELSGSAAKVDAFLRHVWISLRGDVKSRSLFKEIKSVMEDPEQPDTLRDPYLFSTNLATDTVLYGRLLSGEHPDSEAVRHLRAIQLIAANSLLPAALSGLAALSEADQKTLLRSLISTFIRFNVISSGESTELESAVYAVARDLRAGETLGAVLPHLRPLLRADDDVTNAFSTLSLGRAGYQRYLLEELERYLTLRDQYGTDPPDPQESTEIGPADSAVLWIEHIYPQTPDDTWGRWHNHDDVINRLGNLTLIHRKLNAAAKNAIFVEKRPLYEDSQLRLNGAIVQETEWTMTQINERQEELALYVPMIWARF